MAYLSGPWYAGDENSDEIDQPTQPLPAQPELRSAPRPSFDPQDFAETWPELVAIEDLLKDALARNRQRPCPLCIYVRVWRGEIVQIGPQLPRLCERHMRILCGASPAQRVTMHEVYNRVYDWYHAPPDGQYSV